MLVIGYLSPQSADDDYKNFTVPFLQGLRETGYVDGQNVAVEYPLSGEGDRMIRRREFIAGIGSAAVWPLVTRAQQQAFPVIGFLSAQSADDDYRNAIVPFLQGLKETGYVDGQNVAVEYRYAENQYDRLPALAADFVRRRVAVIVANGTPVALAAKAATTIIPIVFATGGDPVALGLVAGLNRPSANVTVILNLDAELTPKRLQLLRELLPNSARFGILADPATPSRSDSGPGRSPIERALDRGIPVGYLHHWHGD
jgi:hypothetical protein